MYAGITRKKILLHGYLIRIWVAISVNMSWIEYTSISFATNYEIISEHFHFCSYIFQLRSDFIYLPMSLAFICEIKLVFLLFDIIHLFMVCVRVCACFLLVFVCTHSHVEACGLLNMSPPITFSTPFLSIPQRSKNTLLCIPPVSTSLVLK